MVRSKWKAKLVYTNSLRRVPNFQSINRLKDRNRFVSISQMGNIRIEIHNGKNFFSFSGERKKEFFKNFLGGSFSLTKKKCLPKSMKRKKGKKK